MTVHSWDENPEGKWHLEIFDKPLTESYTPSDDNLSRLKSALDGSSPETRGYLEEWSLVLYGTAGERYGRGFQSRPVTKKAYKASEETAQRIKRDETREARNLHVKRASMTKRQNSMRTNTEREVSEETISRLAAGLSDLLTQGKTHEHSKRILGKQKSTVSKKSEDYQHTRQGGLSHQSSFLSREDENLLKEVVQSLEDLLHKSKKAGSASKPEDQKRESQLVNQKRTQNVRRNLKVTRSALVDFLRYLRKP